MLIAEENVLIKETIKNLREETRKEEDNQTNHVPPIFSKKENLFETLIEELKTED